MTWYKRNRDAIFQQVIAGLFTGVIVTIAGIFLSSHFSQTLADNQRNLQERMEVSGRILENTRFVRQVTLMEDARRPFMNLDLRGASLSMDFTCSKGNLRSHLNSTCLDLSRSNLSEANMVGANLSEGYLSQTNFDGAFLFSSNLHRVYGVKANFSNSYLSVSNLSQMHLAGSYFVRTDMSGSDLRESSFVCYFEECSRLNYANLYGADVRGVDFSGANLYGVNFENICFDDKTKWPQDVRGLNLPSESNEKYCHSSDLPSSPLWYFDMGKLSPIDQLRDISTLKRFIKK